MTSRLVFSSRLLSLLLQAVPVEAAHRVWWVEIPDPSRPGRIVGAEIHGPSGASAPCAVAVIAHATLTSCADYGYLAAPLAASGWLVALPATEDGLPGDQAALAEDMLLLARALRDGSEHLPAELPPVRPGPFALLGHSLGGGAAVLAAAASQEAGVLALLAPQERPRPSMIQQAALVSAPTLILGGELDCVTPPAEHHWPLYAALASSHKAISMLAGGGHCAFAEEPEPCATAEMGCPPLLDPEDQRARTLDLVLPWLDWRLRDDAAAGLAFLDASRASGVSTEQTGLPTAVSHPAAFRLIPLSPGPDAGPSRWSLELPRPAPADAAIYDLRGRLVKRLARGVLPQRHELSWQGRDRTGRRVPSGVYLLRVQVGGEVLSSRTVRLD